MLIAPRSVSIIVLTQPGCAASSHVALFVVLAANVESHLDSRGDPHMLSHTRALVATVYLGHECVTGDCEPS